MESNKIENFKETILQNYRSNNEHKTTLNHELTEDKRM